MTKTTNYSMDNDNFNNKPLIIAFIITCAITLLFYFIDAWYDKTHYSTVAFVDTVTEEEVSLVDPCGDVWAVDAIPNINKGDLVNVYFYNNSTAYTHTDDVITCIRRIDIER